jgi:hypothetical protein
MEVGHGPNWGCSAEGKKKLDMDIKSIYYLTAYN